MSFYNVRDSKGRFTKTTSSVSVTVPSTQNSQKELYLSALRTNLVMVAYEKNGQHLTEVFTLQPSYLTGYVGKGNSKKAPSDLIYAYDVDAKRFKSIDIKNVSSFVPL